MLYAVVSEVEDWLDRALKDQDRLQDELKTRSHRERSRKITNEHTRSEAAANHSLGFFGWCVKETAAATHSLTLRSTGPREQ